MQVSGNVPELEQLRQITNFAEKCMYLIKNIRKKTLFTHELLSNGFESEVEVEELRIKLEHLAKSLTEDYEKIEDEAKQLPAQTPSLSMINRLNGFLMDVTTNTCGEDADLNAQDVFNWADLTGLYTKFMCELLKQSSTSNPRTRKLIVSRVGGVSKGEPLPLLSSQNSVLESPHRRFESFFQVAIQHHNQENIRLKFLYRYLERSTISCIIELKLASIPNLREYVTVDKQPVCMLKFLLLVNNGTFEYVQFIAPLEDWTYLETSKKQLDLSVESRYDLYRRMSVQGNIIMNAVVSQYSMERNGASFLLSYFSRLYIFDQPCKQCRKLLKDFSPTIISDRKLSYHLGCK